MSGEVKRSKHLPAIAAAIGVDVTWLTTGAGPAPTWAKDQDCDCAANAADLARLRDELEQARMANALLAERLARAERLLENRADSGRPKTARG